MKTYGLIGFPLGHSFSRAFFTERFRREGTDAQYLNFELRAIDELPQVLAAHPDLCGFNVTIPYKQQIIPWLDALSDEARAIGAVNVVRVTHEGDAANEKAYKKNEKAFSADEVPSLWDDPSRPWRLTGYNSDVIGFMDSIRPFLVPHHCRALVLGTGGASQAVTYGLKQLGLEVKRVSRTPHEAVWGYADVTPDVLRDYTVIVNCTPLGMYPKTDVCPPLPYNVIGCEHLLYDLVYNPEETLFLQKGREHGATVKNGLEMLHLQALAAWKIWNETK